MNIYIYITKLHLYTGLLPCNSDKREWKREKMKKRNGHQKKDDIGTVNEIKQDSRKSVKKRRGLMKRISKCRDKEGKTKSINE